MTSEEKISEYVNQSVESGVKPMTLYFEPIYDCYYGEINSFRASVRINSVISGTLNADDYLNAEIPTETAAELTLRFIAKAMRAKAELTEAGVFFKWVSVRCPSGIIREKKLYKKIKELKTTDDAFEKICLEFNCSIMQGEEAAIAETFGDLRAAGLRVAVNGFGGDSFQLQKLLKVSPDYLFSDVKLTRLATNKEKQLAIAPMINFAKSLGCEVVITGMISDEELKEFKARECVGFIPDKEYKGILNISAAREYTARELAARPNGNI